MNAAPNSTTHSHLLFKITDTSTQRLLSMWTLSENSRVIDYKSQHSVTISNHPKFVINRVKFKRRNGVKLNKNVVNRDVAKNKQVQQVVDPSLQLVVNIQLNDMEQNVRAA